MEKSTLQQFFESTEYYEIEYNKAKQKYDLVNKFIKEYKNLYTGDPSKECEYAIKNITFQDIFKKKLLNSLNKLVISHRDEMFKYESLIEKN